MSWNALLTSVRDKLRAAVVDGGAGLADAECELTPDGRPAPRAGRLFVAVHKGSRSSQDDSEECLEETYEVMVTVTVRIEAIPFDRVGTVTLGKAQSGLNAVVDRIRAVVTNEMDAIMDTANDAIGGSFNGFVEPLVYQGDQPDRMVRGDWFHAEDKGECGVAGGIRCGGARRIQYIGSAG